MYLYLCIHEHSYLIPIYILHMQKHMHVHTYTKHPYTLNAVYAHDNTKRTLYRNVCILSDTVKLCEGSLLPRLHSAKLSPFSSQSNRSIILECWLSSRTSEASQWIQPCLISRAILGGGLIINIERTGKKLTHSLSRDYLKVWVCVYIYIYIW